MLKLGTKVIDDLAGIVTTEATAEQIVRLRFDVPQMSIEKLRQLLERAAMTPSILAELFFKRPGMSIPLLERLLNIPKMTPPLLLRLLEKEGMSIDALQALLAKCKDPELLAELLDKVPSVADLQALLSIKGLTPEVLFSLFGKIPISELKKFKSSEGINLESLQELLKEGGITGDLNIIERKLRMASDSTNSQYLSTRAELRVAKQLRSEGEDVYFIDNNLKKGQSGPGISNDMTLLRNGTQVDVKRLSGIGRNAAGDIAKGVRQVGVGGEVIVVRASDSANTIEQFQQFIAGFKPSDPSVKIRVIDENDLPQLGGL